MRYIFIFIALLLIPLSASALEVDYPSFLPLDEVSSLGDMVVIIFRGLIILGGIVAFIAFVYTGLRFIISGSNPGERNDAKKRLLAIIIGLAILLASVIALQLINPNLVEVPPFSPQDVPSLGLPEISSFPPRAQPTTGMPYTELALGQTFSENTVIVNRLNNNLPVLLSDIEELMGQCNSNLCTPQEASYWAIDGYIKCNCKPVGTIEVCDTCPTCGTTTCTGSSCVGDPLSGATRDDAQSALSQSDRTLSALANATTSIEVRRAQINVCDFRTNTGIVGCSTAQLFTGDDSCIQSRDYYCTKEHPSQSSVFTKIVLPIDNLLQAQDDLIAIMVIISNELNDASCSSTTATCGVSSLCGEPVETICGGGRGCPAELFKKLQQLDSLRLELAQNNQLIRTLVTNIDSAGLFAILGDAPGTFVLTCGEAKAKTSFLLQDGSYPLGVYCAPDAAARQAVAMCTAADFYIC